MKLSRFRFYFPRVFRRCYRDCWWVMLKLAFSGGGR